MLKTSLMKNNAPGLFLGETDDCLRCLGHTITLHRHQVRTPGVRFMFAVLLLFVLEIVNHFRLFPIYTMKKADITIRMMK